MVIPARWNSLHSVAAGQFCFFPNIIITFAGL
jgi:hypothetical protein